MWSNSVADDNAKIHVDTSTTNSSRFELSHCFNQERVSHIRSEYEGYKG